MGHIQSDQTMAHLMPGIKRGRVLVYRDYRYQKNKTTNNKIHWRCWNQACKAPLTTALFDLDDRNAVIRVLEVSNLRLQ